MTKKIKGAMVPVIAVDRNASRPLHRQVYDSFRRLILESKLEPGQQVPSSRQLAGELHVSRIPVLGAYAQLLAEGYLETRPGAGTFVTRSLPEALLKPQASIPKVPGSTEMRLSERPWLGGAGPFSVGQLAHDNFPYKVWSDLVARRSRQVSRSSLNYMDPMGMMAFREAIAGYLRTSRSVVCDATQIMIVNGSQQGLYLCAQAVGGQRKPVWVEDPGYEFVRGPLRQAGCRIVPVPVDAEGLDVAAGAARSRTARVAYVTPSHQYPLGVTMSASRRMQLLRWAHQVEGWVIEDDYDSEFRYESMPIASLQGMDAGRRVIYVGTFSKTLFPALRLGYVVIPPALVGRFLEIRYAIDICPPHLFQAVLTDFITEGHFARHIRRTRVVYAGRRAALVAALKQEFGSQIEILGAEAGMHLVVAFTSPIQDQEIAKTAAEEDLKLWPLSTAYLGSTVRQGFILGFASTGAEVMDAAVRRFRRLVEKSGHIKHRKTGH